jgi:uncharacterized DUF497 family protein
MDLELDPASSATNLSEHGIDYLAARVLWSDPAVRYAAR